MKSQMSLRFPARIAMTRAARAFAFASTLAMASVAHATPLYVFTDLGTLPGGENFNDSGAMALNDNGIVVGFTTNPITANRTAFAWSSSGGMVDLGTIQPGVSAAYDINNNGIVTGHTDTSATQNINAALRYSLSSSTATGLGVLQLWSFGLGVNSSGEIAGYSWGTTQDRAISYGPAATSPTNLGIPAGFQHSYGMAINDSGTIAGYASSSGSANATVGNRAVLKIGATWQTLGTLSGDYSRAYDINNAGGVVGYSDERGFYFNGSTMTAITLAGYSCSVALGINELAQIVGTAGSGSCLPLDYVQSLLPNPITYANQPSAFLSQDGVTYDLNSYILNGLPNGYRLIEASDINESGQIVGTFLNSQGKRRPYLLTPTIVPVPSSLLLFGSALGAAAWLRRKPTT